MWSQGVRLDQGRVAAWWAAMEPFVAEMATVLATRGVAIDHPTYSLSSVTISQVASIFGVEEKVGTAVFAESTGHGNGVLMLECALPATLALEAAHVVFAAFP